MLMCMLQKRIQVSWIIKLKNVSLFDYKYSIKGYKCWILVTKKNVNSQDIIFREVKVVQKQNAQPGEEQPEKIKFYWEGEEFDSTRGRTSYYNLKEIVL